MYLSKVWVQPVGDPGAGFGDDVLAASGVARARRERANRRLNRPGHRLLSKPRLTPGSLAVDRY